jgi:hypothetical protein
LGRVLAWVMAGGLLAAVATQAQALRDNFANRQLLFAPFGSLDGNNAAATLEPGEPRHGGKTGGHSLWISWVAPTNGVVKFETLGSSFDTLLSAYYFASTNDTELNQLVELARADDSEGLDDESEIKFGVLAGHRYEIAVDGYFGAAGPLELEWDFQPTVRPPPVILSSPGDRAVNAGEAVTLTAVLANSPNGTYRWYHNDDELDAFGTTLVLPSVQAVNVGRYKLRVSIDGPDFYSVPAEIQINSDGAADALAQNKLFDALGSPLTPDGGGGGLLRAAVMNGSAASAGVSRGYNGTQIFNTTYATPDPAEPQHCGLAGGASFWYAYQPPANGTMTLDTIGSSFDTFLAVYTFDLPFTGYADLISIVCDDNGAGTNGAARLEFAAPRNRQFLVVVDGINGARGTVKLNYRLDTNLPPVAPTLMQAPVPRTAAAGTDISLQAEILGSAPLRFTWRKGTNIVEGATNSALPLANVAPDHSGDYSVTVSSHVGSPLDVVLPLRVVIAPRMQYLAGPGSVLSFSLSTVTGQRYVVEQTDALGHAWLPFTNVLVGDGSVMSFTNAVAGGTRFLRVRVE